MNQKGRVEVAKLLQSSSETELEIETTPRGKYNLRKRKRSLIGNSTALEDFITGVDAGSRFVVFSGSGLSADSGVSTFNDTTNGIYHQACQALRIPDGQKLFSYGFLEQKPRDAQAFFARLYDQAVECEAGVSQCLVQRLQSEGKVVRHYTMNIDGLCGPDAFPIHGDIRFIFCPICGSQEPMTSRLSDKMKSREVVFCQDCGEGVMRSKIVLYQDKSSVYITPEAKLWTSMEKDLESANYVLWIGISFLQAASIEYFQKTHDLKKKVEHVLVDSDDNVSFNLRSGLLSNDLQFKHLVVESAPFLKALISKLKL